MPNNDPTVLIVEDELIVRMCAFDALSDSGLQCYEAGDAEEALRTLEEHPSIALLFTHINMPGAMDGIGLAERVHSELPHVEIIVTSGGQTLRDSEIPDNGTFLPKPYRQERLAALVREKLNRSNRA